LSIKEVSAQACPDFNGDGKVSYGDFLLFSDHFGLNEKENRYDAIYDLDGNEEIDFPDFLNFASVFGEKCGEILAKPSVLIGDFNGDCEVNFEDFLEFAKHYDEDVNNFNKKFDLDNSGDRISVKDFFVFSDNFGKVCS
jgi:Ca2+-binding EF-hand superfamily protein|tara:strand:- start:30 stop:446 length:417 start_codon:yes stop_codon:yes gene_type:complete